MGQAPGATTPASVTPLISGAVRELQSPPPSGSITVRALHRWMIPALVDGSSTSERDENLLESKHSIFLSHSGAQKSFVEQLCVDIERHDRYPFFDKRRDSLSIGCNFPNLIFKAIKQCRVGVVVLSEEFFSRSKWPMLELAALVKRQTHDARLIIMPVFLGITHAQCRDKVNEDRWLRVWQGWAKVDSRMIVKEWQATLKVFGYTNAISLNSELNEVKCRGDIVEAICKEVPPETRWDDSHVHGRSRLCEKIRMKIDGLQGSKNYGAQILGLYGMGGIGKTTACKVLCNDYFEEFDGRVCHLEFGIGTTKSMLQEAVKRLTKTSQKLIKHFSADECQDRLKNHMKKKVFLAIDNVSDTQEVVDKARDLLRVGFIPESIVIVTARSLPQLFNLGLEDCIEMPELEEDDARSLLLYHAAPGPYLKNVDKVDEQLMKQSIKRCYFRKGDHINYHYHPLALKVLGGQLGNDPTEWTKKLNELDPFNQYQEDEKDHPIFSILRNSFEILKHEDQLLFMDVAIYVPEIHIWPQSNIFGWLSMVHGKSLDGIKQRLRGLKSKSLLENLGDGSEWIGMHDLWHQFALMKAKGRESDHRPWIYEKVYSLGDRQWEESSLTGGGWESLRRICMVGSTPWAVVKEIDVSCCSNLKVLKLENLAPDTQVLDVRALKQLKSLEIIYNFTSSSLTILGLRCLGSLVCLNLDGIQTKWTTLYEEIGVLTSLQVLRVQHSISSSILDLSRLNLLQDVIFSDCEIENMIISGLSSNLAHLKRLYLVDCSALRSCQGVGDLVALEEIFLFRCKNLEGLPNLGMLKNLVQFDVFQCHSIQVLLGLGDLVSLQVFRVHNCHKLVELPDMRKLVHLQNLRLNYCPLVKAMPGLSDLIALEALEADYEAVEGCHNLRKLTKLERVKITGWSVRGLPCISDLVNLKSLGVYVAEGVDKLECLLDSTRLQQLTIQQCDFKDLQFLSNLTSLKCLEVLDCDKLQGLFDMQSLTELETLQIIHCESLREWGSGSGFRQFGADLHFAGTLLHLKTLYLRNVALSELPDLSSFPQLRELEVVDCEKLTSLTSSAPLTALESLHLSGCRSLRSLPDLSQLVSLSSLELKDCGEMQSTAYEIEELDDESGDEDDHAMRVLRDWKVVGS